ncbi:hypothetical protein [Streptomyces specialis]|uniref:hypothetical protein n=1 Tax=Streptomyces specialis TaxID=498367 RepID=UPI00099E849E|nr:hypothetical protein [Streptomyces specialis]
MSAQSRGAQGDWQRDVFRELGGASAPADPDPAVPGTGTEAAPPGALPPPARSSRPSLPPPAPEPEPVVSPALGGDRVRHGDPLPRRALRVLRRTLLSSAARQTEEAARVARLIQQPITTGRQIAVTSIRGGAGKSTVAALLALAFAPHRHDPVLAVEADPALGTLARRLGATQVRWTCGDVARIIDPSMQITDVTGYLLPFAGGGWLLPGSRGTAGAQLDVEIYRIVMTSLRRYFGTTVVDCETMPAEVARTALATTQARVLVSPATTAGAVATRSVLDWLGGLHRSMLPRTVVVLAHTAPDMGLDPRKAAAYLEAGGARVVALPYDRALAGGGVIRTGLLGEATREAAALIAAESMDRAMARGGGRA